MLRRALAKLRPWAEVAERIIIGSVAMAPPREIISFAAEPLQGHKARPGVARRFFGWLVEELGKRPDPNNPTFKSR